MRRLAMLRDTVDRIRRETSQNIPDVAINILLSVGFRGGLSIMDMVSKLDASYEEVEYGVRVLSTGGNAYNCAGLIFKNQHKTYDLTHKGRSLVGDLESCLA